jgi:manganese/iron transport system permease protein
VTPLAELFASPLLRRATLEAVLAGVVGGAVGVHVVLRRLPFFVAAMTHATFPGVVVAASLGVAPLLGASAFACVFVLAVWALGAVRQVHGTGVIGVALAGSFGLGVVLQSLQEAPSRNLAALLTGSVLTVTTTDLVSTVTLVVVVLGVLVALHKELVFTGFDPAGARAQGYGRGVELVLLLAVAAAVVATVPAMGTILALALLTVPALAARFWSERVGATMAVASLAGAASGVAGLLVSTTWRVAAGPAIALSACALLAVSALAGPHGGVLTTTIRRTIAGRRTPRPAPLAR